MESENNFGFSEHARAKMVIAGAVIDITVTDREPKQTTKKIDRDHYMILESGEVKEYEHIQNRSESFDSVRKTLNKIRRIINANITSVDKIRWITLTYRENMKNNEKLYSDFDKFWKRFRYFCEKNEYAFPEYISVVEPQGRGAWHIHALFIWENKAPFVSNEKLREIWGNGFVSIKQPKECDNFGAYFTAYLANMPIEDIEKLSEYDKNRALAVASAVYHKDFETRESKKFIKGARLAFYPPGMNLYRHSRGIKKPIEINTTYGNAKRYVGDAVETFSKEYLIEDYAGIPVNRILKASFNREKEKK